MKKPLKRITTTFNRDKGLPKLLSGGSLTMDGSLTRSQRALAGALQNHYADRAEMVKIGKAG